MASRTQLWEVDNSLTSGAEIGEEFRHGHSLDRLCESLEEGNNSRDLTSGIATSTILYTETGVPYSRLVRRMQDIQIGKVNS